MASKYNLTEQDTQERFADTRDTLCYATNDNQTAVMGLLEQEADFAIVVGGYNSSNTSHLVELCEEKLRTYYIDHSDRILSEKKISHYNFHNHTELTTTDFLPEKKPVKILMTSGASCPDAIVEMVIKKIAGYYIDENTYDKIVATVV
jgi:4-hydroxy-3-methylbut-2-enyl diphosphate reductase